MRMIFIAHSYTQTYSQTLHCKTIHTHNDGRKKNTHNKISIRISPPLPRSERKLGWPHDQFQQLKFPGLGPFAIPFSEVPLRMTLTLTREGSEVERNAIFTCMLSKIDLRVSWFKDDQKLRASSKHELVDAGRMHKLIVHDLCPADYTDYQVVIGSRRLTGRRLLEGLSLTVPSLVGI